MNNRLTGWVDRLLDWVYPPKCIICEKLFPMRRAGCEPEWICKPCIEKLVFIHKPVCIKCGRETNTENDTCGACRGRTIDYKRNVSLLVYEGAVQHAIQQFKFQNKPEFGKGFGLLMADVFLREFAGEADCVIPVPMYREKERRRGYNQAAILAEEISLKTGVPLAANRVLRSKNTKPQFGLNEKERENNLKNAFMINDLESEPVLLENKRILLIDDIFTTGSTIQSCAGALLGKGAKEVSSLTLSATILK